MLAYLKKKFVQHFWNWESSSTSMLKKVIKDNQISQFWQTVDCYMLRGDNTPLAPNWLIRHAGHTPTSCGHSHQSSFISKFTCKINTELFDLHSYYVTNKTAVLVILTSITGELDGHKYWISLQINHNSETFETCNHDPAVHHNHHISPNDYILKSSAKQMMEGSIHHTQVSTLYVNISLM